MFIFSKNKALDILEVINILKEFQQNFENCQVYICSMSEYVENIIDIITFNSFADYAPPFWYKVDDLHFYDYHGHWRIFVGHYSQEIGFNLNGLNICDNIIFDRTKYLNGYAIKVLRASNNRNDSNGPVDEYITRNTNDQYLYETLGLYMGTVGLWLMEFLNITLNITYVYVHNSNGKYFINSPLLYHSVDLVLYPILYSAYNKTMIISNYYYLSYPIVFNDDIIVTHNRGLMTPLEKMFDFYGWLTIIATTIILLMVFIVIYLSNRTKKNSRLSFAIFECLRLLINNSIYTRMDTAKMRIFFFVIFLYFLIMQATFSGHLAVFLTKPEYRKNVETLDDLKDPRYTVIYAREGCREYITDPLLLNKVIFDNLGCKKNIHTSESIACIGFKKSFDVLIAKYKLHFSANSLQFSFASLTMRNNWPLNDRVNNFAMRLHESQSYDKWWKLVHELLVAEYIEKKDISTHNYYRPIEFEDVTFAFILLAIGLIFSLVSFVLEMISEIIKSTYKKLWRAIVINIRIEIFQFRQLFEYLDLNFI
ncbi:uncharacterized protein LOC130676542 [Microplitis mediator]|uniref:uncharacterized protein LOC130676542 n=1 Tax=Microplitis mediator TaxID=375433 RepID=UPI002552A6EE|nr:uncharacterized protein LOC130676542 [Microplitis mediator]